ncbi:MAG: hypothetical protein CR967_06045 [Proteobacteria bacterium]|nr:MAG: hypothetical protein CR967_06045 [Pseudomonadota bacterium]
MLIDKAKLPLVDMENMNEVHLEDVDIINDLSDLLDKYAKNEDEKSFQSINKQYEKWFAHTIEHFANEEKMMQEKGFFAYEMHKGEHMNTLARMQFVYEEWLGTKDIIILKDYVQHECLAWLVNHIQTMDTVTARFLKTGISPCHAY